MNDSSATTSTATFLLRRVDQTNVNTVSYVVVFYVILTTLGILLNLLICCLIWRQSWLHTVVNYYVFGLAATDFLIGVLALFMAVTQTVMRLQNTIYNDSTCKFFGYISMVFICQASLKLIPVSVERYIAIVHPLLSLKYKTKSRTVRVIAAMLLPPFLLAIPHLFWERSEWFGMEHVVCVPVSDYLHIYKLVIFSCVFAFPLLVKVYTDSFIIHVYWKKKKSRNKNSTINIGMLQMMNTCTMTLSLAKQGQHHPIEELPTDTKSVHSSRLSVFNAAFRRLSLKRRQSSSQCSIPKKTLQLLRTHNCDSSDSVMNNATLRHNLMSLHSRRESGSSFSSSRRSSIISYSYSRRSSASSIMSSRRGSLREEDTGDECENGFNNETETETKMRIQKMPQSLVTLSEVMENQVSEVSLCYESQTALEEEGLRSGEEVETERKHCNGNLPYTQLMDDISEKGITIYQNSSDVSDNLADRAMEEVVNDTGTISSMNQLQPVSAAENYSTHADYHMNPPKWSVKCRPTDTSSRCSSSRTPTERYHELDCQENLISLTKSVESKMPDAVITSKHILSDSCTSPVIGSSYSNSMKRNALTHDADKFKLDSVDGNTIQGCCSNPNGINKSFSSPTIIADSKSLQILVRSGKGESHEQPMNKLFVTSAVEMNIGEDAQYKFKSPDVDKICDGYVKGAKFEADVMKAMGDSDHSNIPYDRTKVPSFSESKDPVVKDMCEDTSTVILQKHPEILAPQTKNVACEPTCSPNVAMEKQVGVVHEVPKHTFACEEICMESNSQHNFVPSSSDGMDEAMLGSEGTGKQENHLSMNSTLSALENDEMTSDFRNSNLSVDRFGDSDEISDGSNLPSREGSWQEKSTHPRIKVTRPSLAPTDDSDRNMIEKLNFKLIGALRESKYKQRQLPQYLSWPGNLDQTFANKSKTSSIADLRKKSTSLSASCNNVSCRLSAESGTPRRLDRRGKSGDTSSPVEFRRVSRSCSANASRRRSSNLSSASMLSRRLSNISFVDLASILQARLRQGQQSKQARGKDRPRVRDISVIYLVFAHIITSLPYLIVCCLFLFDTLSMDIFTTTIVHYAIRLNAAIDPWLVIITSRKIRRSVISFFKCQGFSKERTLYKVKKEGAERDPQSQDDIQQDSAGEYACKLPDDV